MNTAGIARDVARVFHEELITIVVEQIQRAAHKLEEVGGETEDIPQRVHETLPPDVLPPVRNLLLSLAQERKLDELSHIAEELASLKRQSQVLRAQVVSARPLDEQQREHIAGELQKHYALPLDLHFQEDESLIGGLIIRVGDQVLDNSLRARLSVLQQSMLAS
ncbi:MAG: ATP synthase F1 subunit delta [Chloroflexaceae bacterium]|nr:ATP synthase F1 subunit delta [Chloroflexaceae bacterium]